ncbi:hypothetical protein A2U01_0073497, partial [Trifolium medium]|nr:hypothetical protein [Trifolium medium]
NRVTLRVAQDPLARCANNRKLNCPCTIALRVAPAQARALRQRQKAKPLPQHELRVAPVTENEGFVAV